MSLLPPQFHTHLPHTLGAKITAMPAPPKPPHVHQWLAVPDSKIHSRCAECGTVTLTEIVAPKPAVVSAYENIWATVDFAAGMGQSAFIEYHFGKPYSLVPLLRAPDLAPPVNKTATEVMMKARALERRLAAWAEIGEAFAKSQALAPQRHYTSIASRDGKVRMVETDADGWVAYAGSGQPVSDATEVEIRFYDGSEDQFCASYVFGGQGLNITHWRLAK